MDFTQIEWGQFLGGVAVGLIIAASAWLIARRPAHRETRELRQNLQTEIERRSAAEAKVPRIAELETLLKSNERAIANFNDERAQNLARIAELETALTNEQNSAIEKLAVLEDAQKKLSDAFNALAAKALSSNNESFLKLARENLNAIQESAKGELESRKLAIDALVKPLEESLKSVDKKIQDIEVKREGAYGELRQHLTHLQEIHQALHVSTNKLENALKSGSQQRGKWGEFQLQRLAEMAGMQLRVDFDLQVGGDDGRPDMVVRLPHGGCIPVDAKAPMQSYMESLDAGTEDLRKSCMLAHAQAIRERVRQLAEKKYWEQFEHAPELVVMFVPNDACLGAAFEVDPNLVQYAFERRVALATPITLFALLKAVAYGWQQHEVADNALKILDEVKELAKRFNVFADHYVSLGKDLKSVVDSYNETWGSYSSRLVPNMKRLTEMGVALKPIPDGAPIEALPRTLELSSTNNNQ